jgi:hypothetical protein
LETNDSTKLLNLILVNQDGMQEKMIEIRIDLATMKTEVRQMRDEQINVASGLKEQNRVSNDGIMLASSQSRSIGDANTLAHQEIWDAINKLTSWGRAVAITGSILVMTLSILTIVLELVKG